VLELNFGVDVVAGAQKTVSQRCTLEKLCRALQDENRSLKALSSQQTVATDPSELSGGALDESHQSQINECKPPAKCAAELFEVDPGVEDQTTIHEAEKQKQAACS